MYAPRLGTGSEAEPGEHPRGPARRRVDYGVLRVPRASRAADSVPGAGAVSGPTAGSRNARTGAHGRRGRTRSWRRVVRIALLAGLVLVALGLVAARSVQGSASAGGQAVVVQRGDTIWSLASRHYPNSDPRARVEQIERLNGLDGPEVHPGERLELPAD